MFWQPRMQVVWCRPGRFSSCCLPVHIPVDSCCQERDYFCICGYLWCAVFSFWASKSMQKLCVIFKKAVSLPLVIITSNLLSHRASLCISYSGGRVGDASINLITEINRNMKTFANIVWLLCGGLEAAFGFLRVVWLWPLLSLASLSRCRRTNLGCSAFGRLVPESFPRKAPQVASAFLWISFGSCVEVSLPG